MTNETKRLKHTWRNYKAQTPVEERLPLKEWALDSSDGRRWLGRKK